MVQKIIRQRMLFFILQLFVLQHWASPVLAENFGAIAYGAESAAWGVSWDQKSAEDANKRAMSDCSRHGKDCEVVVHFSDQCGAYAAGTKASGWGTGSSRQLAQRNALKFCREDAKDCEVVAWACCTNRSAECEQRQIEANACESRNFQHQLQGDSYRETCSVGCP